ncbi:hypothetical protein KAR91_23375 [Candidatus Pacearchaeota archaeon]|nr:hypothetical protein [Candidatus Pacearchaeota archaeon]
MQKLLFKAISCFLFIFIICIFMGCTERVPPGYIGMKMTPGGYTGEVLQAGNHSCYFRDRMVLIEMAEQVNKEPLSILCADDLNFKFDLKIRSRLKITAGKSILEVLTRQGSKIRWDGNKGILTLNILYGTYVQPEARAIARTVVSKYETTQIRDNREKITKSIQGSLLKAVKESPIEIRMVTASNFDYPDVIEKAMERKKERQIAIDEEKAKQAVKLLQADNRLKIAQKMKIVRTAEAEQEAVYIKIVGKSLTDQYLKLRGIEAKLKLYDKVGAGDKVIITGADVVPLIGINK